MLDAGCWMPAGGNLKLEIGKGKEEEQEKPLGWDQAAKPLGLGIKPDSRALLAHSYTYYAYVICTEFFGIVIP
jgi:hypothetical protein